MSEPSRRDRMNFLIRRRAGDAWFNQFEQRLAAQGVSEQSYERVIPNDFDDAAKDYVARRDRYVGRALRVRVSNASDVAAKLSLIADAIEDEQEVAVLLQERDAGYLVLPWRIFARVASQLAEADGDGLAATLVGRNEGLELDLDLDRDEATFELLLWGEELPLLARARGAADCR